MKKIIGIIGLLILIISVSFTSCSVTKGNAYTKITNDQDAVLEQSGAQLWGNNCIRCHNIPPPNAYSDNEWDAIVNHMQKVAGFTVSDADKIAEFLKSAN